MSSASGKGNLLSGKCGAKRSRNAYKRSFETKSAAPENRAAVKSGKGFRQVHHLDDKSEVFKYQPRMRIEIFDECGECVFLEWKHLPPVPPNYYRMISDQAVDAARRIVKARQDIRYSH
jgi:hypothetical protein